MTFKKLQEALGKDVLPVEYGGTNGTMQENIDDIHKMILNNRKWLIEQTKLKANEQKRVGKGKSYSDVFGMEGSFRQLEFD